MKELNKEDLQKGLAGILRDEFSKRSGDGSLSALQTVLMETPNYSIRVNLEYWKDDDRICLCLGKLQGTLFLLDGDLVKSDVFTEKAYVSITYEEFHRLCKKTTAAFDNETLCEVFFEIGGILPEWKFAVQDPLSNIVEDTSYWINFDGVYGIHQAELFSLDEDGVFGWYDDIYSELQETKPITDVEQEIWFGSLSTEAQICLRTAGYLTRALLSMAEGNDSKQVDFSPIVLEYIKAVEIAFWDHFDTNKESIRRLANQIQRLNLHRNNNFLNKINKEIESPEPRLNLPQMSKFLEFYALGDGMVQGKCVPYIQDAGKRKIIKDARLIYWFRSLNEHRNNIAHTGLILRSELDIMERIKSLSYNVLDAMVKLG